MISAILLSLVFGVCYCDSGSNQGAFIRPTVNETQCSGLTICNDVSNYPTKLIEQLLKQKKITPGSPYFTKEDAQLPVASRFNILHEGNMLCESKKERLKPQAGWNDANNKWFFLVNHGPYEQTIEVEYCEDEDKACRMTENFPVRTACRQKFIYRKMLALTDKVEQKIVKLPSCCSCYTYN